MSFGPMRFSMTSMRALAVSALCFVAAASWHGFSPRTHEFLNGMAVGVLLVLTISLFYAPRATVERMPHEDDRDLR